MHWKYKSPEEMDALQNNYVEGKKVFSKPFLFFEMVNKENCREYFDNLQELEQALNTLANIPHIKTF